jgi:hypothetical protein
MTAIGTVKSAFGRVLEANSPESMSVIEIFQQQSVFCSELLDAGSMVGLPSRPNNADETLLRWTRSYSNFPNEHY